MLFVLAAASPLSLTFAARILPLQPLLASRIPSWAAAARMSSTLAAGDGATQQDPAANTVVDTSDRGHLPRLHHRTPLDLLWTMTDWSSLSSCEDLLKTMEWPVGSVMSQACHACLAVTWENKDDPDVIAYLAPENIDSMHKVCKEVKGEPQRKPKCEQHFSLPYSIG